MRLLRAAPALGARHGVRQVNEQAQSVDPRIPIIAQMAAAIFTEKQIYHDDRAARRMAVDQAFLLYGEIVVRLAANDR